MFLLTDAQKQLKKNVRDFVDKEVKPEVMALDRAGGLPRKLFRRFGELGYCGLPYDKNYGGGGLGLIEGVIALEELSRGMGSMGLSVCPHMLQCVWILNLACTEEQKEVWLKPAISGENVLSYALSEESGGSDALGIDTIATHDGDGWLLNGAKCWITNGGAADAYIVFAKTSSYSQRRSLSIFYVDTNTPGIKIETEPTLGMNNSPTAKIIFNDCRLPSNALIGKENEGYRIIKDSLNLGRLGLSALAVGMAQNALELSVQYSKNRGRFDRTISSYQGISFPIAEMAANIAIARNMMYHVADLIESGQRASSDTAALKLFSSEMCCAACKDAALIHGGKGFSKNYEIERILRDAQMLYIGEGTSQVCKIIIANTLYNSITETGS